MTASKYWTLPDCTVHRSANTLPCILPFAAKTKTKWDLISRSVKLASFTKDNFPLKYFTTELFLAIPVLSHDVTNTQESRTAALECHCPKRSMIPLSYALDLLVSSLLYESSLGILSRGLATFRSYPGDEVQWQNKKKPWLWLSAFPRMPRFFQQLLRIMLTSLRRRTLSGSDFIFWQLLEMKTWTNPAEG